MDRGIAGRAGLGLSALMAVFCYAEPSCIESADRLKGGVTSYVVVQAASFGPAESLPSYVMKLSEERLLASRALMSRKVVLLGERHSSSEKEALCQRLRRAGYSNVSYIAEPVSQIEWGKGRPRAVSADKLAGIRDISAAEAHWLLSRTDHQPVVLGDVSLESEGFLRAAGMDDLNRLLTEHPEKTWLVFEQDVVISPDEPFPHGNAVLVKGGVKAWRDYQATLMKSLLQRDQKLQVCRG